MKHDGIHKFYYILMACVAPLFAILFLGTPVAKQEANASRSIADRMGLPRSMARSYIADESQRYIQYRVYLPGKKWPKNFSVDMSMEDAEEVRSNFRFRFFVSTPSFLKMRGSLPPSFLPDTFLRTPSGRLYFDSHNKVGVLYVGRGD